MAKHLDNPAGRLHAAFEALKQRVSDERTCDAYYRLVFPDAKHPIESRALKIIDELLTQVSLADDGINRLARDSRDLDVELLTRWHDRASHVMTLSLRHFYDPVQNVTQSYDDTLLAQLEFCSYELHRRQPESAPAEDALKALRSRLDAFRSDVVRANLDRKVRDYLYDRLTEMIVAIDEINIRGIVGLERALDRATGQLFRDYDLTGRLQGDQSTWQKLKAALSAVALVVTTTSSTLQLPGLISPTTPTPPTIVIDLHQDGPVWLAPLPEAPADRSGSVGTENGGSADQRSPETEAPHSGPGIG